MKNSAYLIQQRLKKRLFLIIVIFEHNLDIVIIEHNLDNVAIFNTLNLA